MENKKRIAELNSHTYIILYALETVLRELIIDKLEKLDGERWYKKRLPSDLLIKYKDAVEIEKKMKWIQLIPHHPIYYLDFPDLKKIITRKDNWESVFERIFARKDIIEGILSEIEPIRNKIAHTRRVTKKDHEILLSASGKIEEILGKEFSTYLNKCTLATDIQDNLQLLRSEVDDLLSKIKSCMPINLISCWEEIKNKWWFDETYLGSELTSINDFYKLIEVYTKIPRLRGSGHELEKWLKASAIDSHYQRAVDVLEALIK